MTNLIMPLMGEGVQEATIVKWLKKAGDAVRKNEPVLEVSTDKVDTEIPSPVDGVLAEILAAEGQTVQVHQSLARLSGGQQSAGAARVAPPPPVTGTPAAPPPRASVPTIDLQPDFRQSGVRSSPLVRKIAKENHLNLSQIKGSGLHGRITRKDLDMHLHSKPEWAAGGKELHDGIPVRREKMSRMRQLIADHMVQSVRTSPHVTTVVEIDMVEVTKIREKTKKDFERQFGISLTVTPFLIEACVRAIQKFPIVNSSVDGYDILYKEQINMGCAVALENGLIVPVIKNAGTLNLQGIALKLNDLVTRARSKKLTPEDVQGGTFSITNPGGYGCITSNPIINQPQVAILGIGAIVKRPVVISEMIAIRPIMLASLTFDHRVIDGEGGALFLKEFKQILESYSQLPF